MNSIRVRIRLKKPCSRCDKMFTPKGTQEKLCEDCFYQSRSKKWIVKKQIANIH